MTAEINIDKLSNEDLVRAFDFLDKQGDRTSQLVAIEIGLRILRSRPEIEPILIRLVKQIRDDDDSGQSSRFNLLSALFNVFAMQFLSYGFLAEEQTQP
jgi:hypothetical protein